jgi:hypothetical protein
MNHQIKYLAASLGVILLLTAACSKSGGIGSGSGGISLPGSGGGAGSAPAAISANDKPLDAMTRAMRAQLDAKSYRASVTNTFDGGAPHRMLMEYVAPDSYRMITMGHGGAGADQSTESVIAKGALYMKTADGRWAKSPIDATEMIKAFRDPKMLDELTKTADVKFVGPDTLDGAPMLVYQYTQTNPMGMNLKSTAKTWLSVADGLPRKTETESVFNGKKSTTLVIMSDYNADIKIESPVK